MSSISGRLIYDLGEGRSREKSLRRGRTVIGRAPECDIMLAADAVSRRHAVIDASDDGFAIADLGSLNGIRLNGRRITVDKLRDNDRLTIGAVEMVFRSTAGGAATGSVLVRPADRPLADNMTTVFRMTDFDPISGMQKGAAPEESPGAAPAADATSSGWLIDLFATATEQVAAAETLGELLGGLLDAALQLIPAHRAVVCLYDPQSGELTPAATRIEEGDPDDVLVISQALADTVLEQQNAVLIVDSGVADPDSPDGAVVAGGPVLCAPLFRDGSSNGLIYLDRRKGADGFVEKHLRALSCLAIIAAVGVQQMRLREMVVAERRRREHLGRYLPLHLVEGMLTEANSDGLGMSTCEREVSVLFCDIHRFTPLAEKLPASAVAGLLNEIFEDLTKVVFDLDGTLDKFTGDGLIAVFGAPFDQPDHARRAVTAALRMRTALNRLNETTGVRLKMRYGINSGRVIAGDIGASIRRDYTVIGDVVNVASRLESTVAGPGEIVVGSHTRELLGDAFEFEDLDEVEITGREKREHPFRVVGEPTTGAG